MDVSADTYMKVYDHIKKIIITEQTYQWKQDRATVLFCTERINIIKDTIRMIDAQVDAEKEANLTSKQSIPGVLIDQNKYASHRGKIVNTYAKRIRYDDYYQTLGNIRYTLMNLYSEWVDERIRKQRRVCQVSKKALDGGDIYTDGRSNLFPHNSIHFHIKGRTL